MAALTFAVKSLTCALYFASSFSSRVTLARTMAMLSFIRGTWSFISRMFCSRITSGFSAAEMKNPTKERTIRLRRFHIGDSFLLDDFYAYEPGGFGAGEDAAEVPLVLMGFSVAK